ncbi:DNA repair ATPase [Streptomyces genisteinicus]|uniref:DNA repair ATPase n=1 Tax=Streptomyces genisteinicus TaxID=2768068 RepID=A0A7H0HV35_9ACTN|nr:DNA repair ATPase [Streptomyces genisteinicus]QNP64401.1 DNA repair ATPase [Streptomyces genisteinicus]
MTTPLTRRPDQNGAAPAQAAPERATAPSAVPEGPAVTASRGGIPSDGPAPAGAGGAAGQGASTTATSAGPATGAEQPGAAESGAYEVLRDRLVAKAAELRRRAEALNARRIETFGSMELRLAGTEDLRTEHAATACDIVAVGDKLLFGYDASAAAARQVSDVSDVLALHDTDLNRLPGDAVPGLLDDPGFLHEFEALHRYYRDARLLRLRLVDGRLLAVFRAGGTARPEDRGGDRAADIRVLRWAVETDGAGAVRARFLDARGDRDHVLPPSHDVEWTATTRDDHVQGRHPHVSVGGDVFVSTVGGSLTVKTVNDTETGDGIWSEPVAEALQSLADAEVEYARLGSLLLLRVRPYKEEAHRHLVHSAVTGTVTRLDGIGQACLRLPDDQGIVFPGGYALASTGAVRTFDIDERLLGSLAYERTVRSPNGEDVLFAFRSRTGGSSLLLPYNLIRTAVAAPLTGNGHALFDDGTLLVLRSRDDGPGRVHPVQRWDSPFVTDTWAAQRPAGRGPLARIGNAELVRGISDCLSLVGAVTDTEPSTAVFEALLAACARTADGHHWLGDADAGDLRTPLDAIGDTARQVVSEFETVRALTGRAAEALEDAAGRIATLVRRLRGEAPRTAGGWVDGLTALRRARGELLTLGEMRYADTARIDALAERTEEDIASFATRAMGFLRREDAFAGHRREIEALTAEAESVTTVAETAPVGGRLDTVDEGLRTVTEVVTGLEFGDAVVRTGILERIAEVLGGVNRARAVLDARRRELLGREGRAEFAAETALLGQAVTGALAASADPETCDTQLSALLLRLENLESRFAESDAFLAELGAKRTEVYEAFAARRQTLQDARARRAERLAESALRVLDTITRRLSTLGSAEEIHTWFASDPMAAKVRRTADELRELGDDGRAEELEGRLKAARQEAARALRDRTDLYAEGGSVIRLGRHRFTVNTQPFELTLVPQGDGLAFALTGTDYRAPVTDGADAGFAATRPFWEQTLPSENTDVYRAEHLAARLLAEHGARALADADIPDVVRRAAQEAYDEGYERGVHDHDAASILTEVVRLHAGAGLLRHPPRARAAAQLFWAHGCDDVSRAAWSRRAVALARARDTFGLAPAIGAFLAELAEAMGPGGGPAADYLFEELASGAEGFVIGARVRAALDGFHRSVDGTGYAQDLQALGDDLDARRQVVENWLASWAHATRPDADAEDLAEAAAVELCPDLVRRTSGAPLAARVEGLLGDHPRLEKGVLTVRLDEFLARTRHFRESVAPGFRDYQRRRSALAAAERERLRLDEHRPRVMSSFVRNRLVDEVYLPLIGDSLAKQMGAAGQSRRTDSNGLLLLLSPPGYGKTTLVEYVADRLGLALVRVNGPALGHTVTSLDPAQAPNATARQEVEKINFALEAGSNVLLYLDDIQHVSPELLQKFISLCDAQRRMEGVWDGRARTYDLRGKRFAVCMAGNPYTESGQRFRIPDMLANRADVWDLGEVLTGKEDVFALSFVENALTSHPVLAPLAGRDRADVELLVRLAEGDATARADRLAHPYAPAELDRVLAVLRHVVAARRTVLAVNSAYIASAASSDATRGEPPFRLQGSYRNMNRIVERISPVMNDAELEAVVDDHYAGEARTLANGAEGALLALAGLRSRLTAAQAARWSEIRAGYVRAQALGGPDGDPLTKAVAALGLLADRLSAVETAITRAADPRRLPTVPVSAPDTRPGGTPADPAG